MFTKRNRPIPAHFKITKTGIISLAIVFCVLIGVISRVQSASMIDVTGDTRDRQDYKKLSLSADVSESRALLLSGSPESKPLIYNGISAALYSFGEGEWVDSTEERVIPYSRTTIENPRLPSGTVRILRSGSDGLKLFHKRSLLQNGNEVYSVTVSTDVVIQPIDEIAEVGTFELNATSALSQGTVTSDKQYVITPDGTRLPYERAVHVMATAYTTERQSNTLTFTETTARVGAIAVDPSVIPLGSKLYICSADNTWIYGIATAEDTGSLIKGHRIDLFFNTYNECIHFGYQPAIVYILK
ncbi:MAG: 3D domain-containing protein [Oscillospiraceae bacterium]|jgi:3D (Asp-Asp-Asp) domain-containing protein